MHFHFIKLLLAATSISAITLSGAIAAAQTEPGSEPSASDSPVVLPTGQVDPTKPVDVVVMNNTATVLSIGFPGGPNVSLEPSDETKVSFASAPLGLFIYPLGQNVSTRYETTTAGNTIKVEVIPYDSVTPGDRAINVSQSGIVYIFSGDFPRQIGN